MVWLQLWLQAVFRHIAGVAGMSKAGSSSFPPGESHAGQSADDLPDHLVPLSRLLARMLRYNGGEPRLYRDDQGWVFFEDILRFTPRWTKDEVQVVLALSANHRGKRFECDFRAGGQPKVRATQRESWRPPPRRRPTPSPSRRHPDESPQARSQAPAEEDAPHEHNDNDNPAEPRSQAPADEDAPHERVDPPSQAPAVVPAHNSGELHDTVRATSSQYRTWRRMQEGNGVAWVCEKDTSVRFREDTPGPWTLYQDPHHREADNRMKQYWYNEETEEWFFRS